MSLTQRIVEISFYHPLYRQSTVTFYFSALCRAKSFPGFPAKFSEFFVVFSCLQAVFSRANKIRVICRYGSAGHTTKIKIFLLRDNGNTATCLKNI